MKYHIVLTKVHAERLRKASSVAGELPKFDLSILAERLNAAFILPKAYPVQFVDRIRANLAGSPENWAYARAIASKLGANDVVFCPGEEIGIPLAGVCRHRRDRPKIVVWFHRITGLKARIALKQFKLDRMVDLAVASSTANLKFLQNYLDLKRSQILLWWNPVDVDYFAAKTHAAPNSRPLVVSSGLERRDYRLLAAATADLDLDVKIAGFSQFQSRTARNLPEVMPENMSNQKYSLPELVELYYRANLVVLCLRENDGTCGVTVLLEAMSCGKTIVCTHTTGLKDYLQDQNAITVVDPGDVAELQTAIVHLLNNPQEAKLKGELAYKLAKKHYDVNGQIDVLAKFIRTLEQ